METTLQKVPPQNPLAKAINYTLKHWPNLITYCDQGDLQIDNNLLENQIRPFALGRRNWLFLGNERGAKAAANIYSLLMTAKANQLEPYSYLSYLFEKLPICKTPEDYEALLPKHYQALLKGFRRAS